MDKIDYIIISTFGLILLCAICLYCKYISCSFNTIHTSYVGNIEDCFQEKTYNDNSVEDIV